MVMDVLSGGNSCEISEDSMARAIRVNDWYTREYARIVRWQTKKLTSDSLCQCAERKSSVGDRIYQILEDGPIRKRVVDKMSPAVMQAFKEAIEAGKVVMRTEKNARGSDTIWYELPH